VIEADSPSFLNADRSIQRASLYFFIFIFVVLLVGAEGPVQPPAQRPEDDLIAEALRPMRSSRPRREADPAPDRPWESRTRLVIGEDLERLQARCLGVVAKREQLEAELGAILTQLFSPAGDPPSES